MRKVVAKSGEIDTMVLNEAIRKGEVSKAVNPDKQKRHTKDGHLPGRSYIDGDIEYAQELIDKLSGTGKPLIVDGKWLRKERVVSTDIIGTYVDINGIATRSKTAIINYSKTGSHIYPVRKEADNEN